LGIIDTPPFLHFDLSVCILLFEFFMTFIRNAFGLSSPIGTHLPDEPKKNKPFFRIQNGKIANMPAYPHLKTKWQSWNLLR